MYNCITPSYQVAHISYLIKKILAKQYRPLILIFHQITLVYRMYVFSVELKPAASLLHHSPGEEMDTVAELHGRPWAEK